MKPNKTPRKSAAYADSRRQSRRLPKAKAFLAVLVAFCTVFSLMMPAATLEGQAQAACGLTEHTHDENCCESILVCGQEEGEAHTHDESCYEEELICTVPEHTHSEECYANPEPQSEDGEETGETGAGTETETETKTEIGTGTETETETETETDQGKQPENEPGAGTESDDETKTDANQKQDTPEDALTEEGKTESTENAEIAEDAENTQAEAEAAALPDGAEVPEGYTQQYTVRDEENGFAVTVYAPEGALPEDAVLSAELLSEETEEYAVAGQELAEETEAALAENGIDLQSADSAGEDREAAEPSYGFAAMDIHFEDAEGNEIEPAEQVYVVIDAAGLIPEDVDPESVTVQHHAEQEDGSVAVETVADTAEATDGVVAVVENAGETEAKADVQAAFEVDGFSTFTITWGAVVSSVEVNVSCINFETREPLPEGIAPDDIDLFSDQDIQFGPENQDLEISGYTFVKAEYSTGGNDWNELTFMKANYHLLNGRYWDYTFDAHQGVRNAPDIRLYYIENGGSDNPDNPGGGEVTENATVTTSKTAVLREDGNYDLTLSITGDRGSSSKKQNVDVLFILDESNSMAKSWGRFGDRMDGAKAAISQIMGRGSDEGLSDNENLDVQYALVGFGGGDSSYNSTYRDAGIEQNWTSDVNRVYNAIPDVYDGLFAASDYYGGGTNYEAGFRTGKEVLRSGRSDALTVVIFVSDGGPGYYYTEDGNTDGTGSPSNYDSTALKHAVNECKTLDTDYFYFVGVTSNVTGTVFNDVVNAVNVPASNKDAISANDPDELLEAFKDIEEQISFFAATDVTIMDPLSVYADLVLTDNEPQFTISIRNGTNTWSDTVGNNGTVTFYDAKGVSRIATARFNSSTRTIYLDLPEDYELEEGYTYSISTVITPSQAAVDADINSEEAQKTPDPGTGTHADENEQGFWSNDNENAKVNYTANGENGSEKFPKPVIQVQEPETGDLTVRKVVSGPEEYNKNYSFTISTNMDMTGYTPMNGTVPVVFTKENGIYTAEVSLSVNSADGNNGFTISGLPLGTYVVAEDMTDIDIEGYRFDGVDYSPSVQGSHKAGTAVLSTDKTEAIVTVTNTYTRITDITVTKVDGNSINSDKPVTLEGAEFYLVKQGDDGSSVYYKYDPETGVITWVDENDKPSVLTSDASGEFIIRGLEDGQYTLIETKAPNGYQLPGNNVVFTVTNGTIASVSGGAEHDGTALTVSNFTGTELPETGGPGTTILTIGGLLLMAGAVGGGYGLRRRRGKEGR